jgi:asparagine N-glycosylation enzyme membrane subunit Stt3
MKFVPTLVFGAMCVLMTSAAAAQNEPPANIAEIHPDTIDLSQKEFWAAMAVIAFSVLILIGGLLFRRYASFTEDAIIRILALVLIVTGTLFLVTLGYTAEQISPALGILGTIAGYMLGRSDRNDSGDQKK